MWKREEQVTVNFSRVMYDVSLCLMNFMNNNQFLVTNIMLLTWTLRLILTAGMNTPSRFSKATGPCCCLLMKKVNVCLVRSNRIPTLEPLVMPPSALQGDISNTGHYKNAKVWNATSIHLLAHLVKHCVSNTTIMSSIPKYPYNIWMHAEWKPLSIV